MPPCAKAGIFVNIRPCLRANGMDWRHWHNRWSGEGARYQHGTRSELSPNLGDGRGQAAAAWACAL